MSDQDMRKWNQPPLELRKLVGLSCEKAQDKTDLIRQEIIRHWKRIWYIIKL